jgi:hypothetical protein
MRPAKLAVLALVVVALSGCVPTPPPVVPTAPPTPAATPVFASNAQALAAAKAAYEKYLAVSDEIFDDGGENPDRLLTVATPAVLKFEMPGFEEEKSKDRRTTGASTIDQIVLESYFPNSASGVEIVTVYACVDVSNVDVLDSDGHSVVPHDRPDALTFESTFDLRSPSSDTLILSSERLWTGASICTK